jgi:hypothetical protein
VDQITDLPVTTEWGVLHERAGGWDVTEPFPTWLCLAEL